MDLLNKNPYILCSVFSLATIILMYINNTFIKKKKEDFLEYFKIALLVSISVALTIFLVNKKEKTSNILEDITDIVNEPIHTGNPNF